MDNYLPSETPLRAGTVGGTLLVLLTLNYQALLETAVLAMVGAVVSYTVSVALKALHRWVRKG